MANTKLMKVMEYLINEQEDKARDLLHQIFIEKARAIHEEMISDDEDEMVLGGDMGEKLKSDIEEVEAEEYYDEAVDADAEDDMDVADAVEDLGHDMEDADEEDADEVEVEDDMEMEVGDDDHMDGEHEHDEHEEHEDIQDQLHDLEAAIDELKKEFEAMQGEEAGEDEHADHDEGAVAEAWEDDTDLDEEYDDLDESMDLDTVAAPKSGEVGSGKFARAEVSTKSAVPPSQRESMNGAKPVVTGKGPKASGYDRQTAPSSTEMTGTANRRKKATDGMSAVSKEGDAKALLNKDRSEGYGAIGTKSPISGKNR